MSMRKHAKIAAAPLVLLGLVTPAMQSAEAATTPAYTAAVNRDNPSAVLYGARDAVSGKLVGTYRGNAKRIAMPNGNTAMKFDGASDYVYYPSRSVYGIAKTGMLTVEYQMRPDTLQFSHDEGSGYVYVLGKGSPGKHEWYGRMYNKVNAEERPNRISGYAFNPKGGLGAGSYTQNKVVAKQWIHITLVFNSKAKSSSYPMGYLKIYRNGVLRDKDSLADYNIKPVAGNSPLRVGTGYFGSYFKGAVGPVAFYNKELSATRIAAHNKAR